MDSLVKRLGNFTAITLMVVVIIGLIFQSTMYWWLPVTPGEAYGLGDLLHLLLVFIVLLLAATTFLASVLLCILWQQKHLQNGIKLTIIGFSSLLIYFVVSAFI